MKQIIKNQIKKIIKCFIEYRQYRKLSKAWKARHLKVKKINGYKLNSNQIAKHRKLWSQLSTRFSNDTLKVCAAISQKDNYRYVPEELFEGVIEKKLNGSFPKLFENKSYYKKLFHDSIFVDNILHKIGGIYYDMNYDPISTKEVNSLLDDMKYPVIVKKSLDTGGGRDIIFAYSKTELFNAIEKFFDLVVQPVLSPHPYFKQFHDYGLNTIRVCLYKPDHNENIHLLNANLRLGRDGHLDNETQGGLVCNLDDDGKLNKFVVDKNGTRYYVHPNSGIEFSTHPPIPNFEKLKEISIALARKIPCVSIISLDLAMDDKGDWKIIEINLRQQTIRFSQYAGKPFFGKFTQEVIDRCK